MRKPSNHWLEKRDELRKLNLLHYCSYMHTKWFPDGVEDKERRTKAIERRHEHLKERMVKMEEKWDLVNNCPMPWTVWKKMIWEENQK